MRVSPRRSDSVVHDSLITVYQAILQFVDYRVIQAEKRSSVKGRSSSRSDGPTPAPTHARATMAHEKLQQMGMLLGVCGLAAIEYSKISGGRAHLISWHGKLGAMLLLSMFAVAALANRVHTQPQSMKPLLKRIGFPTLASYWRLHRVAGWTVFSALFVEMILGMAGYGVVRAAGAKLARAVAMVMGGDAGVLPDISEAFVWLGLGLVTLVYAQVSAALLK